MIHYNVFTINIKKKMHLRKIIFRKATKFNMTLQNIHRLVNMRFTVLFNVRCQQLESVKLIASHLD